MEPDNLFKVKSTVLNSVLQVYNRTEESLHEDVSTLKKWMEEQPHLPEVLDKKSLRNFLIMNKCSIERAKQRIDMYYTLRSKIPELYTDSDVNNCKKVMDIVYYVPMPELTKENYRIFFFKIRNPEKIHLLDPYEFTKFAAFIQEIRLKEDSMFGDIFVCDFSGPIFEYLKKNTPSYCAKSFMVYEKIWSLPLKGIYIINSHPFVSSLLGILKTLLKPKIFDRIHVCQDAKILEKFPKSLLPKDYGGEQQSLEEIYELLGQKIAQYESRVVYLSTIQIDEKLRPEKLENDENWGLYGNFKKLSVD